MRRQPWRAKERLHHEGLSRAHRSLSKHVSTTTHNVASSGTIATRDAAGSSAAVFDKPIATLRIYGSCPRLCSIPSSAATYLCNSYDHRTFEQDLTDSDWMITSTRRHHAKMRAAKLPLAAPSRNRQGSFSPLKQAKSAPRVCGVGRSEIALTVTVVGKTRSPDDSLRPLQPTGLVMSYQSTNTRPNRHLRDYHKQYDRWIVVEKFWGHVEPLLHTDTSPHLAPRVEWFSAVDIAMLLRHIRTDLFPSIKSVCSRISIAKRLYTRNKQHGLQTCQPMARELERYAKGVAELASLVWSLCVR